MGIKIKVMIYCAICLCIKLVRGRLCQLDTTQLFGRAELQLRKYPHQIGCVGMHAVYSSD